MAKKNSFNDLAAAYANKNSSGNSSGRNSIGGYKAIEASSSSKSTKDKITRDPRNGAFTFQVHAEYDLLLHIQKDLDSKRKGSGSSLNSALSSLALSDIQSTKIILKSIDDYCYGKQWMYHIGSEKGKAISRFLRGGVESWMKRKPRNKVRAILAFRKYSRLICCKLTQHNPLWHRNLSVLTAGRTAATPLLC